MKQKKTASILKKFLLFNFTVFSVLGIFTIIYLEAIQPNLVKDRTINHKVIISNTADNFDRLSIDYSKEGIRTFLLFSFPIKTIFAIPNLHPKTYKIAASFLLFYVPTNIFYINYLFFIL